MSGFNILKTILHFLHIQHSTFLKHSIKILTKN